MFLVNVFLRLTTITDYQPLSNMARMSTILQVRSRAFKKLAWIAIDDYSFQIGLLGVTFIAGCSQFVEAVRGLLFYALLAFVGLIVILFPIGDDLAIVVLVEFVFGDVQRVGNCPLLPTLHRKKMWIYIVNSQICIVSIYIGLLGLTVAATIWHVTGNRPSNTRVRKIFHILIVMAFIPGLLYQCTLLFVASGIALALLIALEIIRVMKLWPLDSILNEAVKAFIDEKDAGLVALTPIYLLVGCSIPLWLHPCPCDLTDAAGFELLPLLAGVLSVGIGDTAASVIGSKFGRIKYPGNAVCYWNHWEVVTGSI